MTQVDLTTVELFSGIGGFRIAADAVGLKTIWANDVSPKAAAVYKSRFGSAELHEGDIRGFVGDVPEHDVLTAGFPCQPFSSAGKKEGFRDTRGHAFSSVVEVLRACRPRFFVLENVKRLLSMESGYHFSTILAALTDLDYAVEWRLLNAMHMGLAQNRQRVIIIGSRDHDSASGSLCINMASRSDLEQLSERQLESLHQPERWRCIGSGMTRYSDWGVARAGKFHTSNLEHLSDVMPPVYLHQVLQEEVAAEFDFTENTLLRLQDSGEVNRFYQGVQLRFNQGGGARMGYTVFGTEGVAPTLTGSTSRHYERYEINGRYRRLTNIEYARLQGFSDDHCSVASIYDQYNLLGNAVPPPIVKWALGKLFSERPTQLPLVGPRQLCLL
jgi:DNA (cytosine-5)-methyltransferase 1